MKMSFILCLVSLLVMSSAHATDCKSMPERFTKLAGEIQSYNELLRKNYQSRLKFTIEMYAELSVNEGRSLYIHYGTYDSYKRSIAKEQNNTNDVNSTTRFFDAQLQSLGIEIKHCL